MKCRTASCYSLALVGDPARALHTEQHVLTDPAGEREVAGEGGGGIDLPQPSGPTPRSVGERAVLVVGLRVVGAAAEVERVVLIDPLHHEPI